MLAEHGAVDNLLPSGDSDLRALFRAAYSYSHATADAILSKRPDLLQSRDQHGRSPLHEAATNGDMRTVRVLLRHGVEVNAPDDQGETPLDRASAHRQRGVVKILEKHAQLDAAVDADR